MSEKKKEKATLSTTRLLHITQKKEKGNISNTNKNLSSKLFLGSASTSKFPNSKTDIGGIIPLSRAISLHKIKIIYTQWTREHT